MKSPFDFHSYKRFLVSCEESRKVLERGFRTKLASVIGCQSGYISHVLNGDAHLSLEQALKVATFLDLKPPERKYFLLLVECERASTRELKDYFAQELKNFKEEFLNLQERVGASTVLSEKDQSQYYSSWHYLAIHVLTSLDGYNDAKSISQSLKIPEESVRKVLLFLLQAGIISESKHGFRAGLTQVHLNRESPLIRQHHTNWRIAAIQSLANEDTTAVHYSAVSTLSKADAEKLRTEMVALIERYVETIRPSKDETMYGFNLDFYGMLKD